jgi:hypothetical protein
LERLVTTSQAAEILGLSLQGIHYRIKKNQLKSIKRSGKTFVYIDEDLKEETSINLNYNRKIQNNSRNYENIDPLIEAKNEQIILLKKSIKWMKKQYGSEINRLEKNQKKIIEVFNSEIKLLQSAFNEMKSIYNKPQVIENKALSSDLISLKDFFIKMKRFDKSEKEIKLIIFKAIQKDDKRFIYNKKEKKLLILNDDFKDLV